ncbi:TPA: sugar phosphate isomerase/epimerase [Candidatus Poribacteria bacterium]|nr:sugar phosphate isomerase/epimerase [Candidatus Poribacteria bacterium]
MTKKVLVGAHPWVYAAKQENYDIYPIIEQIFSDMSYAGLDGIELMHMVFRHDGAVEKISELSQKYSLPVIGSSFGGNMWNLKEHDAILEEAELAIKSLAKLGGRTLGTSVGSAKAPKTTEQLDAQAFLLRKIIAICSKNNVVLNLHNHTYEVENNEHDLSGTLARIPDIKLGPDLNWLLRAGIEPVDFIHRHASRIVFLHLRDQKADGKWSEAMGEGDMDYVAIGRALKDIGFSGDAVIELAHEADFKPTRPLRESLKISREFVLSIFDY